MRRCLPTPQEILNLALEVDDVDYTPSLPSEDEHMEGEASTGAKRPADTLVPERRMRQKGYCDMVPGPERVPVPEDHELLCYTASEKRPTRALQEQANQGAKHKEIPEDAYEQLTTEAPPQ